MLDRIRYDFVGLKMLHELETLDHIGADALSSPWPTGWGGWHVSSEKGGSHSDSLLAPH